MVVQMLLDKRADVNDKGREHGTALLAAITGGHEHVIQLLLHYGADPSISVSIGLTPVHISAMQGPDPSIDYWGGEGRQNKAFETSAGGVQRTIVEIVRRPFVPK
jgi:ankyrin repeat protein